MKKHFYVLLLSTFFLGNLTLTSCGKEEDKDKDNTSETVTENYVKFTFDGGTELIYSVGIRGIVENIAEKNTLTILAYSNETSSQLIRISCLAEKGENTATGNQGTVYVNCVGVGDATKEWEFKEGTVEVTSFDTALLIASGTFNATLTCKNVNTVEDIIVKGEFVKIKYQKR